MRRFMVFIAFPVQVAVESRGQQAFYDQCAPAGQGVQGKPRTPAREATATPPGLSRQARGAFNHAAGHAFIPRISMRTDRKTITA